MKKTIYLLTLLLSAFFSFSQDLSYNENFDKTYKKRSDYKTYTSKDSILFKLNDQINLGVPSRLTFKNTLLFQSF